MPTHDIAHSATTEGLTVAPSLDLVVEREQVPGQYSVIDKRVLELCGVTAVLGVVAAFIAQALLALIALTTNLAFFGSFSLTERSPAEAVGGLGLWVIPIPVIGAIIVGLMARFGSKAIRGHGWLASGSPGTTHLGFPVLNDRGVLIGVLTRREVLDPAVAEERQLFTLVSRLPRFVYDDSTVREAAIHMVNHQIGRLPVVRRDDPRQVIGIITRSDVLSAFQQQMDDAERQSPTIRWPTWWKLNKPQAGA